MLTEVQTMSLESEPTFLTLNCSLADGNPEAPFSSLDHVTTQQPAKKQTRQWAAWTRQEEEIFFTALRQYGKNFEKITYRVESKNKDQVRHYYYRLVRRMNKLLGPGLHLDAKNSKDTIAAMLRWWSLLEKYSCKASRLHLKPRRFKLFLEALENQLLKDRKKNLKKRHSQGENCVPSASQNVPNPTRALGSDARAVKLVLVDSQNIQKTGSGKACNINLGVNHGNPKETSSFKIPRQRKKPANSYRRWEKAAIAGVSLVADAAEHLERARTLEHSEPRLGENRCNPPNNHLPPLPHLQNALLECNVQASSKLKLQLFPIDEITRIALEKDNLNPYLELTLSNRKKISSVLEHLTRKWGSSSISSGKIMLFPYSAKRENIAWYQQWGQDSCVSVGDVNLSIGNPAVFRLRYGWISTENNQDMSLTGQTEQIADPIHFATPIGLGPAMRNNQVTTSNLLVTATQQRTESGHEDEERSKLNNVAIVSTAEWADNLTNMSLGDLLSDATDVISTNDNEAPISENRGYFEQSPFICDSFDAAIAAHISKHHNKMGLQSTFTSQSSSFFDAEDTCDAFSFRSKSNSALNLFNIPKTEAVSASNPIPESSPVGSSCSIEELPRVENHADIPQEPQADKNLLEPNILDEAASLANNINGLSDIYWPDSLGPLEYEIPSCRYNSTDLILSESLGGLNGLIASSLDAFQNCSFFGTDKKEVPPTAADAIPKHVTFPAEFKTSSNM